VYKRQDIFSCDHEMAVAQACEFLKKAFGAEKAEQQSHDRGSMSAIRKVRDLQTLSRHQ